MPDVDTFVVTGNTPGATAAQDNVLSPPALTYSVELLRRLLGDPMETFETKGASLSRSAPPEEVQPEEYVPRTELGRKLWEIRKRIVAAGEATMTWEDIEREVAERWGGVGDRYE